MEKRTIGFRGDQNLIDLISVVAAGMGKKRSEFITFCIVNITKAYDPKRYEEYKAGKIEMIETTNE